MHIPWRPHLPHLPHREKPEALHDMLFIYQHESGLVFICGGCGRIASDWSTAKHMAHMVCKPGKGEDDAQGS